MSANVNPGAGVAGAWLPAGVGAVARNPRTTAMTAPPVMNERMRMTTGLVLFIFIRASSGRFWSQLLGRRRVDHRPNASDLVGREPSLLGVSPHGVLVRRDVHTVDLVIGDVALEPLDLRAHVLEDPARFLRNRLELLSG